MVREHPFFLTLDSKHLPTLCAGARIAELAPGELLFQTGKPANQFFLVQSGKAVLQTRDQFGRMIEVKTLGFGEVLGWSWLVSPFCWHLDARAVEETRVVVLDGAHLLVAAEEDPRFGYALMKRVAQLMAQRMDSLRLRLIEECEKQKSPAPQAAAK